MDVRESGLDSSAKADYCEHSNEPSEGEFPDKPCYDKVFRSDCSADIVVSQAAECEGSAPITAMLVIGHNPDDCFVFPYSPASHHNCFI
jgi:hypothetical protein